jgi:hypothetical protein
VDSSFHLVLEELKKFLMVPKRETSEQKVTQELEVTAAKVKAMKAHAVHAIAIGVMTCSASCLRMTPKFNWTVSLGRSTTTTPGRCWMEQSTRDFG